jgi:hypothetical protein
VERLLDELRVDDSAEKRRQALGLIDSLARELSAFASSRMLVRPTGENVRSVADLLTPLNTKISSLRLHILERRYEEAVRQLHVSETFEGGEEPGLYALSQTVLPLLTLSTQELVPEEEAARAVPDVMLSPPADLMYGVPPITIPLWNLLARRGRLEREEARRALVPAGAPEQLERDFDAAWDALVDKGYAETKVDKKGRTYLEYRR